MLLTVEVRSYLAAVTVVPEERFAENAEEPCTDDAMVGHAASAREAFVGGPSRAARDFTRLAERDESRRDFGLCGVAGRFAGTGFMSEVRCPRTACRQLKILAAGGSDAEAA